MMQSSSEKPEDQPKTTEKSETPQNPTRRQRRLPGVCPRVHGSGGWRIAYFIGAFRARPCVTADL